MNVLLDIAVLLGVFAAGIGVGVCLVDIFNASMAIYIALGIWVISAVFMVLSKTKRGKGENSNNR